MVILTKITAVTASRPSRARGLKLCVRLYLMTQEGVAPLAGAWIET